MADTLVATKKTTKKSPARAKNTRKKAAAAKKKVVKKKSTKKKSTKKKVTKKKVTKKKVTKKKVTKKKVTKKKVTKKKSKAAKKPAKKVGTAAPTRRRRGQSVAEAARAVETDANGFAFVNGRRVRLIATPVSPKARRRRAGTRVEESGTPKPSTVRSPLSAKELREFRDRLMKYRASILQDLGAMEREALQSTSGDVSHMPMHMADVGSDAYDQDLKLGMAASERQRIRDIDDALNRIKDKTYGVCAQTLEVIPMARLRAKPWAKYTKEAAERLDRRR